MVDEAVANATKLETLKHTLALQFHLEPIPSDSRNGW